MVFSLLVIFAQWASAQASGRKEIKDSAEYHAYMSAIGQQDIKAKISELESFLRQYPDSIMKEDGLGILIALYERTSDSAKAVDTGHELLAANPCNLRALSLLTYESRRSKNLDEAKRYATKGNQCLQTATKPAGMSDEAWNVFKKSAAAVFNNDPGGIVVGVVPRSSQ
jgi:hypothetical protein